MTDLETLAQAISKTFSPNQSERRAAEAFLQEKSSHPALLTGLLQLLSNESTPVYVQQASAVYVKNHVIKIYSNAEWDKASIAERDTVKGSLLGILLASQPMVRRQLSEALAVVAENEYPEYWPNLVPQLATVISEILGPASGKKSGKEIIPLIDWHKLQGAIETLVAIFDRYTERERSNELYTEIKFSLTHVQDKVKALFSMFVTIIYDEIEMMKPGVVQIVLENASLLCKMFYCLSWQDFPEYFEDNMKDLMTYLRQLLVFDNEVVDAIGHDDYTPSCHMQSAVLEVVNLYAAKFDEDFRPYLKTFLEDAWSLLVRRGNSVRYDNVAINGMKFLTIVARGPDHHHYENEKALSEVCKSIIIPNMLLRADDIDLFEDNPTEYLRRDMEGSDVGTRRRGAMELVKGLCIYYETAITTILSGYVKEMLSKENDWYNQDAALYIVTALGWRSGTATEGATETSSMINVMEFFENFVLPQLLESVKNPEALETPIFTADLIKYAMSFRQQISIEGCMKVASICGKLLRAEEPIVRTYAASCVERILAMRVVVDEGTANGSTERQHKQKVPRIGKEQIEAMLPTFLPTAILAMKNTEQGNEYLMRLVLRFCSVARDLMAPFIGELLPVLVEILKEVTSNPRNPHFNHYLFESMAAIIRFNANKTSVANFEKALMEPMCNILVTDVTEFGPYVFQILSQLMLAHEEKLPDTYDNLLPPLLAPQMWERRSYIPGMTQFIDSYIRKAKDRVVAAKQLEQILGIVQKLLASKATDHHALQLLTTLFEVYDLPILTPYILKIFKLLMFRLHAAKTAKLVKNLICCISTFVLRFGVDAMKQAFDGVDQNVLQQFLQQIWIPEVPKIWNPFQRRLCAIALTEVSCGSELCTAAPYLEIWPRILEANVALTEGIALDQDRNVDDEEENVGPLGVAEVYTAAHYELKWGVSTKPSLSPIVAGKEPKKVLAVKVNDFVGKYKEIFVPIVQNNMEEQAKQAIMSYMNQ
ncbi:Importin-beta [Gracilaria domingensis]|nr:Importin-beta [Gracilaria domingensis]